MSIQRVYLVQSLETFEFLCADEDSLIGFTTDISKAGIFYEYESALESALEEIGERFFIFSFFVKCEE